MKKTVSQFALLLSLFPLLNFAQTTRIPCYTDQAMEQRFASDPEAKRSYDTQVKISKTLLRSRPVSFCRGCFGYAVSLWVYWHGAWKNGKRHLS